MPYAINGDVSLFYETFGDPGATPLLLINGLGSQSINFKDDWCARFVAAGFFVIRYDNRDVGLSTRMEGRPPYSLSDMASDALAVLDGAGVGRAHVLGVSMGGMIVQRLAIEHPERLWSLTSIMSTTGDPDVGQPTPEAMAAITTPAPPDREGAVAQHIANNRIYGSPAEFDAVRLRANALAAYDRAHYPEGVARQFLAIRADGSRTAALGQVEVPALVIHGDQDRLVDISGGRRTAAAIPGARLVVLTGMGHDYPPSYWDRIVSEVASHAASAAKIQS